MPIEIRELVIRASVQSSTDAKNNLLKKGKREDANEMLVQESVEQVFEILKKDKER
jgi:hypothetical protein